MKHRACRALIALLCLASLGCRAPSGKVIWSSIEVDAPSDRVVWQLALLSMQNQGFPMGPASDSSARAREVESGWKTDLQPFRGEGKRQRVVLRMTPLAPGRWKLEARVRSEHNQNLVSPLDPTHAEWEPADDDEASAQILLMHVRSRLAPEFETVKEPEARSGAG